MRTILSKDCCEKCDRPLKKTGNCMSCSRKGKLNPFYKHGKWNKVKCIDCGKGVSYTSIRCQSCCQKGKLNHSYKKEGSLSPSWKGGKPICNCGREMSRVSTKCSICEYSNRYGENNSNWKNGLTKIGKRIRNLKVYKEWYGACLERDNYTCQKCGAIENIEVHHIISIRAIIKEYNITDSKQALEVAILWMLENGITYCKDCHCLEDKLRHSISERRD